MFVDENHESAPKRRTFRILGWGLILFVLLCAGVIAGAGLYIATSLQPVNDINDEVRVTIEPGMSSKQISDLLEDQGLIRNAMIFRYYLQYKGWSSRLQAGEYVFTPEQTIDEIVAQIMNGEVVAVEMDRVTVPEGYTINQIAARMASIGPWSEEEVLKLASQKDAFSASFLQHIPEGQSLKHTLEGYLFPETYDFLPETSEQEVLQTMLAMTEQKLKQLPEDWEKKMEQLELDFHKLMTIASLIEREVVADHERPIVAGVIYNRLQIGMMLQIDATVQYALGEQKEVVLYEDLKVDSPYNTYAHLGLPPGPIASPSLKSIEAALYPEETDYLYYVTKKDGSYEHWFSKTYDEHLQYKNGSK